MSLYTYSDIVNGVVDNLAEGALDWIIANSTELATVSGSLITTSGIAVFTYEDITVTGTTSTGTYSETITSGTAGEVSAWRLANYKQVFIDAQQSMKQRVYFDSITTVSERSDMSTWDNLLDDNVSTGVDYTLTGTTFYIELQKPSASWTTAVRARVNNSDANAFFAYSENGADWTYLASDGSHTVSGTDLTEYASLASAETNYIDLALGNNLMTLPEGIDVQYHRMYLTGTGYSTKVIDFDFSNTLTADDIIAGTINTGLVQIGDAAGKMIISGSTLKIYDDDDNLIIELGELI